MEFLLDHVSPWLRIPRVLSKSSMMTGKICLQFHSRYENFQQFFSTKTVAPLTTAFSPDFHLTATHFNQSTKLSVSPKVTASFSNVTSSIAWVHASQLFVNGAVTRWNHGVESVVPSEMRRPARRPTTMKWTFRKKFSFSTSEMKTIATSSEAATRAQISAKVIFIYRKIFLTQIEL